MNSTETPKQSNPISPISKRAWIILGVICTASLVGHLALLPYMPEQVPTHFATDGTVNGWTDKLAAIPLFAMPLLMLVMLYFVPKMDPRGGAYNRMGKFYLGFVTVLTLFVTSATWLSELSVFGLMPEGNMVTLVINVLLGIILVMLGNYMPKVKRNYTFGVKTPWALDDDRNWRLTHRFAGAIFVAVGIVTMACGLLAGALGDASVGIMLAAILGGSLAVGVYSYLVYRNGNKPLRERR